MIPKAFLFDLDGVLTDTAEYHYQAWKELADRLALHFTREDNERLKGVSRIRSCEILMELNGWMDRISQEQLQAYASEKNERYVKLIQKITPEDVLEGVLPFLREAKKNGIRLAVASASKNAVQVLKSLRLENYFDYIADANRISRAKPDPEVFLDCSSHLGAAPPECVGFEDSQAGIEAIKSAGMYAVGIGVKVTGRKPNLALDNTGQLDYAEVIRIYKNWKRQEEKQICG